jgi:hypothetical protein
MTVSKWWFVWSWTPDPPRWMMHYTPVKREKKWLKAMIHKIWFYGKIRRYDIQ